MTLPTPAEARAIVAEVRQLAEQVGTPEAAASAAAFEALARAWDAAMRPAFADAAERLGEVPDDATPAQIEAGLSDVLGILLAAAASAFIAQALPPFLASVLSTGDELGATLGIRYGGPDRRTRDHIRRVDAFWVTHHGERILEPRITRAIERAAAEGTGQKGMATALQEALGAEYDRSLTYWHTVAVAATNRAGMLGRIAVLEQAGRDGRVDATIDVRTSGVCRFLDGKTYPLAELMRWRDTMLAVSNPEDVIRLDPWWDDKDAEPGGRLHGLVMGNGGRLTAACGCPGFHGGPCRSVIVAGETAAPRPGVASADDSTGGDG